MDGDVVTHRLQHLVAQDVLCSGCRVDGLAKARSYKLLAEQLVERLVLEEEARRV